jgi:HSP20 family protein
MTMNMRDLIPWGRNQNQAPTTYRDSDQNPFLSLHRDMNRLFDEAFRSFDSHLPTLGSVGAFGAPWPSVEISDTEKEIRVTAEVPGLEEDDIEVLLDGDVLTLRGEKRSESEDKDRQFTERYYGRFERRIPLGAEVEEDRIDARFRNGVLTVVLPKSGRAQSQVKRIQIKH